MNKQDYQLRQSAAGVLRSFLDGDPQLRTRESRAHMRGFLCGIELAGAIDNPEYDAAHAAIYEQEIPSALRCRLWWGMAV